MGKVVEPLCDDLNTPLAITAIHHMAEEVADDHEGENRAMFRAALNLLGLLQTTDIEWRAWRPAGLVIDEARVIELIAARADARKAKNFAEADSIRAKLDQMGVQLQDTRDPETRELVTTWEVKR
jgi:cysteinyl-tRNA synthetase